ncbi:MAG TPA: FAD-dependent oxidoreductase [Polyangiaceae bacterium]|nr:FAD-dependent oxidoreductase [Polyangiaceae bacterium]
MPERADADVVVVGGGPAGAVSAARCAREGLRVVLVERHQFPRDRPGETLHPGAEVVLRELGAWEPLEALAPPRHEGTWVEWGGPARFEPFGRDERGPWRGLQAWRADLDRILLDTARRAGATVLQPAHAQSLLVRGGRVLGVQTSRGPIAAAYTIDASGGAHWLARRLGLPVCAASQRLLARYGHARGECALVQDAPRLSASAAGWTWLAHVGGGRYAWASLPIGEGLARGPHPAGLEGLTASRERSADVTWRAVRRAAGPGYLAVGDAAFVLDPASSHGVLKAMVSGALAARAVTRTLGASEGAAAGALSDYDAWLREWFARDVSRLSQLYANVFRGWRGAQAPHGAWRGAATGERADGQG